MLGRVEVVREAAEEDVLGRGRQGRGLFRLLEGGLIIGSLGEVFLTLDETPDLAKGSKCAFVSD